MGKERGIFVRFTGGGVVSTVAVCAIATGSASLATSDIVVVVCRILGCVFPFKASYFSRVALKFGMALLLPRCCNFVRFVLRSACKACFLRNCAIRSVSFRFRFDRRSANSVAFIFD